MDGDGALRAERAQSSGPRNKVIPVHELPGRIRVRMPMVGLPALDTDHLARLLRTIPGVASVRVNAGARSVIFEHDGAADTRARLLDRLALLRRDQLRFRGPEEEGPPSPFPLAKRAALLLAMPVLPQPLARGLALATIAPRVILGARTLLAQGVKVELLDALAVSLSALRGQFATAVTTDMMMETGEYLERTTMRRSGALLQDMLMPNPEYAWVAQGDGAIELPFSEVKKGDIVLVQTGELVPVDGVVVAGRAQVNQASITGESLPETKTTGDAIIAGSHLESGRLKIEAREVGSDTTTARIAEMIRASLEARSDTEKLATKLADRQVYVTLGLGALALLVTRDLRRLSSVFLVDYACPLKLSAPVAVRATMSQAVARGILIKGGPSIEKLARVDTFVFDKTGTLTRGELTVTDVTSFNRRSWPQDRLLAVAASMEEHSQHPVARAIVAHSRAQGLAHQAHGDVHFEVGYGLTAEVGGKPVLIGSRHYLEDREGIDFSRHDRRIEAQINDGSMPLFIAAAGKLVGLICLQDELRDDAADTMRRLRAGGAKQLIMLTGDRRARAEAIGAQLGLDAVHAELHPEDKARILSRLKQAGHQVAFVGDGINDAPALAEAAIGFSMPRGSDIAQAASDIALLDDRISAVADAQAAARQAMGIIRTNTNLALGINTGLFLAASAGRLSPVAASLGHNGSTFGLLLYALSRAGLRPPE